MTVKGKEEHKRLIKETLLERNALRTKSGMCKLDIYGMEIEGTDGRAVEDATAKIDEVVFSALFEEKKQDGTEASNEERDKRLIAA